MKKTTNQGHRRIPLRRERIRALTPSEARGLAGGTSTSTMSTLTPITHILFHCIPETLEE
jgi:hypothetical protein